MSNWKITPDDFDAVGGIRVAFLLATATVLLTFIVPDFRSHFLVYGARSSTTSRSSAEREKQLLESAKSSWYKKILTSLAALQVSHSWFWSFYAMSVLLSLFWMLTLPLSRPLLAQSTGLISLDRPSTPFSRTQMTCILMLCQGIRRLTECLTLQTSSNSTMWVGHWLVGLLFYIGMSMAVWIEGVPALIKHEFSIHDVEITAPSIRTAISLFIFLFASGIQHDCHAYLASLRRDAAAKGTGYQLPTFPAFSWTLTPHYFMECLIYVSLAVLAAPEGHWLNGTIACALIFVVTNLGVTAYGTKKWYERKFGKAAVAGRAAMIPFIF